MVDKLNSGETTFKEEDFDKFFREMLNVGIKFTTEYQVTDVYIVSAQTLNDKFTKKVGMQYANTSIGVVLKVAPEDV